MLVFCMAMPSSLGGKKEANQRNAEYKFCHKRILHFELNLVRVWNEGESCLNLNLFRNC